MRRALVAPGADLGRGGAGAARGPAVRCAAAEEADALSAAQAALLAGDRTAAVGLLTEAIDHGPAPEARLLLAELHYLDDDLDACRRQLEACFAQWRDSDPRRAAVVAAELAELHTSGLGNRAAGNGWLQRARRLLDAVNRCPERGHVELALVACEADDVTELLAVAEEALALAAEFGDHDLEVRALADSGYALVVQGRAAEGFARLDEAMAALSAGEVRGTSAMGKSFCALLSACDRAGDVRRAEEWSRLVEAAVVEPLGGRPRVLHGHCRLAYGSVLCSSGRWADGEAALLEVLGPEGTAYVAHRSDAAARLAAVWLQQGRVDDAPEPLRPYEDRPRACEPLARVHLLTGSPELARAVARRGLGATPGDLLADAAALGVLVEVELACLDVEAAEGWAARLATLAQGVDGSGTVAADALLARARVAAARLDAARAVALLGEARTHRVDGDRPLLSAAIALELAQVLAEQGEVAEAVVEARLALEAFERLGARPAADRCQAVLRALGAPGRSRRRPTTSVADLTGREQEVLALLRDGLTNAEIGQRLYISPKTAEHHVGRVLAKLGVRSRAEAAAVATAVALTPTEASGP